MRALLIALVAGVIAAPAAALAAPEDASVGGFVLVKGAAGEGRDDALLSLPGVDFDSHTAETSAVIDGKAAGFRMRVRAEAFGDTSSGWPDHSDMRVKELSYSRRLTDAWSVSFGKQQRSWGSALSDQPLGFFRSNTDLTDPLDTEGRIEGLPMAVVTRLGEKVNIEAIVSAPLFDDSTLAKLNGRQWAIRFSGDPLPMLNASLILRQRDGAAPGVGVSATYATGAIEAHLDAFYGPPQARLTYAGFTDPTARLYTASPFTQQKDGPSSLRTVVGLSWTPTEKLEVRGEWSHRDDGLSANDWDRYLADIDLHRAKLATPQGGLAFANLAWDLSAARTGRRDHLLLMGSLTEQASSYSILTSVSLDDGSAFTSLSASWNLPYRAILGVGLNAFSGGARTELGVLPFKGSITASLRRPF